MFLAWARTFGVTLRTPQRCTYIAYYRMLAHYSAQAYISSSTSLTARQRAYKPGGPLLSARTCLLRQDKGDQVIWQMGSFTYGTGISCLGILSRIPAILCLTTTLRTMPRKRQLTDAEKDDIWRFHKEHPLVTHTDVASK